MSSFLPPQISVLVVLALLAPSAGAAEAKVYVILWFDTEDYLLPASDDAALQVADFLTREGSGPRSRSSARRPAPWSGAGATT